MKKLSAVLLLALALTVSLFTLAVGAEDAAEATGVLGTNFTLGEFISLAIAALALIVVIVLCIVKRKKLVEALHAYKSEMKKITWFSRKNTVRCTVFVVVSVVVLAIVIGLLDIVFFEAQNLLTGKGFSFFGG
ncbi:MAG: preprotein translocase subunit SecE [Clostridia bacterium]|nr:preprotein translocase subunit SecE [Clostridia bacterium]